MEGIRSKVGEIYSKDSKIKRIDNDTLQRYGMKDLTLRHYQVDGVNWLLERLDYGNGCILGDEMGLGKTCQTISLLVAVSGNGQSDGPHLIISPLSVLNNWIDELRRFAPDMKTVVYMGTKEERPQIQRRINRDIDEINVIVTTYEMCLKDSSFFHCHQWHTLVVDEAHRLKNSESQLYQKLKECDVVNHILLTGTPVQNNLLELYNLLSFVAPRVFPVRHAQAFVNKYQDISEDKDKDELHDLLKPFLLRRVKSEVIKDLPKKTEVILYHGISALQKKYYKAILTKDISVFENSAQPNKTRLMNILMQLRKCVNHPYLFDGVEPEPFVIGQHLVDASGKLILLDQLLSYLRSRGHKVLIFSQMTRMLDILQDYLGYMEYTYERLDGSVRGEERYLAIQNFNEDDETFAFLLSTRAGGQGLNLTAADTVIFLDSDFNPQNDLQAAARAHRLGQTRPVKVIRLIGRSTVEEIILRRAEAKLQLTDTVIEGGQFSLGAANKEELITDKNIQLQDILKFGVDRLLENEESTVEDTDFDAMLGRTVDCEWTEDGGTQEAKASMAAASLPEEEAAEDVAQTMYMFEGMDYATEPSAEDKKAFDDLITVERAVQEETVQAGRTLRTSKSLTLIGMLPESSRKPKKQLTPEELEERRKKRAETAARRAREAEEEEIRRAQEKKEKLKKLWEENGYVSCNIVMGDDDDAEENLDEELGEEEERRDVNYISGDVTHPSNTGDKDCVIVHCVDDSGRWGTGGLFTAISARSNQPEEEYEEASKMKDLALGDAHLVSMDDRQSREEGKDYVALIIAQHRDQRGNLSGIKLTALSQGLQRVCRCAKQKKASVHLPRIGHNTPGFNWYGTERLIRKHLVSKGIPTYIYYYPRKQRQKRRRISLSDESEDERPAVKRRPSLPAPTESVNGELLCTLPNFFEGTNMYLHGLSSEEFFTYRRYIIAYNGNIHTSLEDSTTHLVADIKTTEDKMALEKLVLGCDTLTAPVVSLKWLDCCIKKGRQVKTKNFCVTLDS